MRKNEENSRFESPEERDKLKRFCGFVELGVERRYLRWQLV